MKIKMNSQRVLEIIPGTITWIVISSPLWAGLFFPKAFGIFVIIFISYWLTKGLRYFVLFFYAYYKILKAQKINWLKKLQSLKVNESVLDYKKVKIVVIIPFASEPITALEPLIISLKDQDIDTKQIVICFSSEAKFSNGFEIAKKLKKKYEAYFGGFFINVHKLVPGEVAGKGSNANSAARYMQNIIDENFDINYTTVLYTDCDSVYVSYAFSYFLYLFVQESNRYTIFWTGAMNFMQNFWSLPYFSRVINSSFSYFNIPHIALPQTRFIQISSFFLSWKLFQEVEYSDVDIVSDDYHLFFKALFKHYEKTRTQSMFMIIDSDACEGSGTKDTFVRQFYQVERWTWGVEDFPYVCKESYKILKNKGVSLRSKIYVLSRVIPPFINHQLWPITGIFLGFGTFAVSFFALQDQDSLFWLNLSTFTRVSLSISIIIVIVDLIVSWALRPKLPSNYANLKGRSKYIFHIRNLFLEMINWYLLPYYFFILGGISALSSHTKLLLGKYIGFKLTEKK